MNMPSNKSYDLIIWGASGFTGRLVAEYLFQQYTKGNGEKAALRWAMAGRNKEKLEKVRSQVADDSIPLIIADSHDRQSLEAMSAQSKVICTTVGPYGKYGSELVAACIATGTHCCDLTGEVLWMRDMIDKNHESAKAKGVKIVHTCGFDSIPSDMGVYYIQQQVKANTGQAAQGIKMRLKAASGGLSGGTYASMNDTLEKVRDNKKLYKTLIEPYSLNPEGEQNGPDKPDLQAVVFDKQANSWIFPFIMAGINTKVVRRSNALAGYPYGKAFRYDEAVMSGKGISGRMKGIANAAGLGLVMLAKPGSFLRKMLNRFFPKPGEGPNKQERENGFYNMRFYTTHADGSTGLGKVTGDRDPGYGSTSKMLAECGICLAKDQTPDVAGVLTPSIAMGDALLKRLQANAGLTFEYKADA